MAESNILNSLRNKRDDIERAIVAYEAKLAACRRDLSHIIATLVVFEASGDPLEMGAHVSIARLFKRGEAYTICRKALEASPAGLDTRQLALAVMRSKGLDEGDAVIRKAIALTIVHVMRMRWKRGLIRNLGRRKGVSVWTLTPQFKQPNNSLG